MRTVLYLILLFGVCTCYAQQVQEFPHKVGLKTSINISSMVGTELQNARPKFGYTAGAYILFNPEQKWSIYTEAVGSFRGSKFSNGDSGYSRISSVYIDLAALPVYNIDDKQAILIGPYASYLALSSLFIGPKKKPEDLDIGLWDSDAGIAAYYHLKGEIVTVQLGGKYGLLNVNRQVNFIGLKPATGGRGSIHNLSIELGLLF
jgi:hypothetical protein